MGKVMDMKSFYAGDEFEAWKYLGVHPVEALSDKGYIFRTYAPSAAAISVIGDFSAWDEIPMVKVNGGAVWEAVVPQAHAGDMYKFRIRTAAGKMYDHADPVAFSSEMRPGTASVIADIGTYQFHDENWIQHRSEMKDGPLNIYEMHLGSWKRKQACEEGEDPCKGWYSYTELADLLIPYLKENGYNAVEFMPLTEYPADESWGYQATGFFSATSRYGSINELCELIDRLHQNEIIVLLDVVTVHFAANDYALWRYDGTSLFEYPSDDVGRSEWGSCNFMHAHGDVRSFLQSSCDFWFTQFHFDGMRYDAVSNLIYWQGDYGRGENKDAILFLQKMNRGLKKRHPGVMLIAEDSTMYEKTTWIAQYGGLNFDYKWDLGWMNDTLEYLHTDYHSRPSKYHKLVQSMNYYHQAYYLLPLSHDEVVHEKGTLIEKIHGQFEDRMLQLQVLYLYMMAHPGKKLNFMGNEMALTREWNEKRELDWRTAKAPIHASFIQFIKDLNGIYLKHPALWERDYLDHGFEWIENQRAGDGVIGFTRCAKSEKIICLCNFSERSQYIRIPEDMNGKIKVLLSAGNSGIQIYGADIHLPAFSGVYLTDEDDT